MNKNFKVTDKWVTYEDVQKFFNYKPTQMAKQLKSKILIVARSGKRVFVLKESIERLLEALSKI